MRSIGFFLTAVMLFGAAILAAPALAHEGHDHDKPPPLNLPVAPRVVAITPDFELVGVSSGKERLTIFLHTFATNEPIKGAKMSVSSGDRMTEAESESDGVFSLSAPWLASVANIDLVFSLTLADGTQDLLTGQLQRVASQAETFKKPAEPWALAQFLARPDLILVGAGGLMAGVLMTLLFVGGASRRQENIAADKAGEKTAVTTVANEGDASGVTPLRRSTALGLFVATALLSQLLWGSRVMAAEASMAPLPSIPSTMATDLAQRMPDSTLFVPKATQHLLSVRTVLTARAPARLAAEITGTIIAGPEHFGRVQPGRPGRIEAAPGGLAYIGKRVRKGELLGYVKTYIEAADRANMDSLRAETEARIEKNRTILSRYERSPGAVPQVRVDEIRGELEALKRKRAELLPSAGSREPIIAPVDGVVSRANATIGQIVEARDVLFEIVDPSQFWVEAVAFNTKLARKFDKAVAMTSDGRQIPVEFAGRGLALRQQATVLTFRISGKHDGLAIGIPVKVVVQSTTNVDGFVLPASAVVRGQTGLPIVWVKTEAERFEPRNVQTRPLDGKSIVVTAGLKEDLRVVTDGVTLLNQVR